MKSGTMRASSALRHIEHLASLDLDSHIAIPEMLRTLHRVVPGVRSDFRWVDAFGTVIDTYRPETSAAAAPGGLGELRLDLVAGGQPRAVLTVHQAAPLGERERQLFRAAAPSLGRALGGRHPADEQFDETPDAVGALTATRDGRLASADASVLLLLAEMDGRPLAGAAHCRHGEQLPGAIAALCRRSGGYAGGQVSRVTRWGAYRAQLFVQCTDGKAADPVIIISKHLPRRVRLMRTLAALDLSPRERQVAFQLGIGADTGEGAAAMGVSVATWRSYVKRIYVRLDVRDRLELHARLNQAEPWQ